VADRRPDRDFVATEWAGHDKWVGEDNPSSRPEQTLPVGKYRPAIGKMVDRIDAQDRVERGVLEGQLSTRIGLEERCARLEPRVAGRRFCDRHCLLVELDPGDQTSRLPRDVQGGTTRTASNI